MLKRQRNWNSRNLDGSIKCYSESESCSVVSDFLRPHGLYSLRNSLGQNTREGSRSLLQGIFPTWGSNPGLPHCRWILYQLSHKHFGKHIGSSSNCSKEL